ncbi:MAG TPA: hypothetical protein DCL15_04550, partial [Chloroflexi bacterium]|nr:hypothetical protein [Chloroflexota bacterium]
MNQIPTKMLALGAAGLMTLGLLLIIFSIAGWPDLPALAAIGPAAPASVTAQDSAPPNDAAPSNDVASQSAHAQADGAAVVAPASPTAVLTPTALPQLAVALGAGIPDGFRQALSELRLEEATLVTTTTPAAVHFDANAGSDGEPVYAVTFAAATRFDTIDTTLARDALQALWSGRTLTATTEATTTVVAAPFTRVVVLSDTLPL